MKRLLYVLPDLDYNGAARQMLYLATGLPRDQFEVRVCVLGHSRPWLGELKRADVPVQSLGWRRRLDARPLFALRKTVRDFQPDIIHAWRMSAARACQAAAIRTNARLVASAVLPSAWPKATTNWLDRRMIRRADLVLAATRQEAETIRSLGLASCQVAFVPPGVAHDCGPARSSLRALLGLKPDQRLLVCVGPLETEKGFRDAVWALDILRFILDDVHLVFLGSGPAEEKLQHFARILTMREYVHFLGPCENVRALMAEADIVWVPSHRNTGVNVVLEAMAAGRPLITAQLPAIMELLPPELKAFTVAPDDQGALARQTRLLLDQPDLRERLGETGLQYVNQHHSVQGFVAECARLYETISK
jgi:glycosyltransferase involved in cell wall biosynthesis